MNKKSTIYLVNVLLLMFFFCGYSLAKQVEIKKAIEIIKLKEKTIKSIRWVCKSNKYNSDKSGILTPINTPPLPSQASVFVDSQGHYRVKTTTSLPDIDDITSREFEQLSTFDGSVYRTSQSFFSPKAKTRIEGYIYHSDMIYLGGINWNLYPEGIGYVFPYFAWPGGALRGKTKQFSEYLEYILSLKRIITVEENDEGVWTISVPDYVDTQNNITVYVQIEYDPSKGESGAILSARRCDSRILNDKALGEKVSYVLQKVGDFYVPQTVKQEQLMGYNVPSQFTVLEYSEVEINVPLTENDFIITWKNGTEIVDYIAKKNYVVTGEPEDEADAVHNFMIHQGLDSPPEIPRNNNTFRNVIFGLAIVIIVLSIIYFLSKRRIK